MLAYVFWHWPRPDVDQESYENRLVEFHGVLAAQKPLGLLRSAVYRAEAVPWITAPGAVYEDWYLLAGSGTLDVLNDAAITPPYQESHERIALCAAGGAAGLYRLRSGSRDPAMGRLAFWFAKPERVGYAELYQMLDQHLSAPDLSLWGRQMVLGPTPEFCLLAPAELSLPSGTRPIRVAREPIWSGR